MKTRTNGALIAALISIVLIGAGTLGAGLFSSDTAAKVKRDQDLDNSGLCNQAISRLPDHMSPDGIPYKLVVIEGKTFVATSWQPVSGYVKWELAGPIDR